MPNILTVPIHKPDENVNVIVGQSHFIKTVEDLYEVLITVPGLRFGLAFAEASGAKKVRSEANDPELGKAAAENCLELGCGHSFVVMLRNGFPIHVLNAIKAIPEVCAVFCASANPLEVIVAETGAGRGVLGVIDGERPQGIENREDISWRKQFLRELRYKL